jgi:hypothetical protein
MHFDLDAIEESTRNTFDVVVGHQDIDGQPGDAVGFRVLGPGSAEYLAAERSIQIMNVKEAALRKTAVDLTTDEGAALVADGGAKRRQVMIDHCVVGWFGFVKEGQPAEFDRAALGRLLKARPMWATRLMAEIENEANFGAG